MGLLDDLSDVQLANLCLLMMIRDSVLKDVVEACCRFGIDEDLAQFVTAMSHAQIFSIIANLGNESLFLPRPNLTRLLSLPLPLLAPVFAVHPPQLTTGHTRDTHDPTVAVAQPSRARSPAG